MLGAPYIAIIGIAVGVAGAVVLVAYLVRTRCPACRKPTLELDVRDNPAGSEGRVQLFRCTHCAAEYRRQDGGPLIPKIAWEAGARDELPRAKVRR